MIRPFRPADYPALAAITRLAFDGVSIDQNIERLCGVIGGVGWEERKTGHLDADIAANPSGILVYEVDGHLVGYVSTQVNPRTRIGGIPNLAVHPDHQGKGIGTQLLHAAIGRLRAERMLLVRIETLEQNRRCCALYPKLGFQEVARQIHYVLPLADAAQAAEADG